MRPRLRNVVVAAALVAAATGGLAIDLLAGGDTGVTSGGPLKALEGNALGVPSRAGTPFSYGVPVVVNTGTRVAVLERIRLDRPTTGIELVGSLAAGAGRRAVYDTGDVTFPPRRSPVADTHPLRGFRVAPEPRRSTRAPGAELIVGLRAQRPGRYVVHGIHVDYRVGERRYSRRLPNALAVCIYDRDRPLRCAAPAGDYDEDLA